MKAFILVFSCLQFLFLSLLPGQNRCNFDKQIQEIHAHDPQALEQLKEYNKLLKKYIHSASAKDKTEQIYYIPVVFHIVWAYEEENINDERIKNQLLVLNRDFSASNGDLNLVPGIFRDKIADTGIRFYLAKTDPAGNPSTGIYRYKTDLSNIGLSENLYHKSSGGADAWNPATYLNIWIANTGDFLTGKATFPGQGNREQTGLVIHPKFVGENSSRRFSKGRVAVHEMGHYLGLYHTWGTGGGCNDDDEVEDTPLQEKLYEGCPLEGAESCGSYDMFMNYMDYVDDACMAFFSSGQAQRMRTSLKLFRPEVFSSSIPVGVKFAPNSPNFDVFPNPSSGLFKLRIFTKLEAVEIILWDILGNRIFQDSVSGDTTRSISLEKNAPGIYLLQVGNQFRRIMVR